MSQDEVTLGDKNVEIAVFDRYKGRKNVTDRVAIVSKNLVRAYTYFYEGNGKKKMFRAPKNAQTLEFCKKHLGEPVQYFGLALFHYSTQEDGTLLDPAKLSGKIKTWRISETRYEELSTMHKSWPLLDAGFAEKQFDLMIKCTEEQWQRMQFTPAPQAHWKSKQAWYDFVKKKEALAKDKVAAALGTEMKDEEIMELLGASGPAPTGSSGMSAGDVDLSDIVDDGDGVSTDVTAEVGDGIAE